MKRHNFFLEEEMITKLKRNKKKFKARSVGHFIRLIIESFFKNNNL